MLQVKESLSRLGRLQAVPVCVGTSCFFAVAAALPIGSVSLAGAAVNVASPPAVPCR